MAAGKSVAVDSAGGWAIHCPEPSSCRPAWPQDRRRNRGGRGSVCGPHRKCPAWRRSLPSPSPWFSNCVPQNPRVLQADGSRPPSLGHLPLSAWLSAVDTCLLPPAVSRRHGNHSGSQVDLFFRLLVGSTCLVGCVCGGGWPGHSGQGCWIEQTALNPNRISISCPVGSRLAPPAWGEVPAPLQLPQLQFPRHLSAGAERLRTGDLEPLPAQPSSCSHLLPSRDGGLISS